MINLPNLRRLFKHDEVEKWLKSIEGPGKKCFKTQMKIYAPTCYGKCEIAVKELIAEVTDIYKGSTVYDAEGAWTTPQGQVETEPIKVVEMAHDCTNFEEGERLARAVTAYATKAKQHSISVHQGSFYISETPEMMKALKKRFGET